MAKKNENIISLETRSGIKVTIDKRVKDDVRLLFILADIQDTDKDATSQIATFKELMDLLFGDGSKAFLREISAHHDGVVDTKALMEELTDIFEALNLKNS